MTTTVVALRSVRFFASVPPYPKNRGMAETRAKDITPVLGEERGRIIFARKLLVYRLSGGAS